MGKKIIKASDRVDFLYPRGKEIWNHIRQLYRVPDHKALYSYEGRAEKAREFIIKMIKEPYVERYIRDYLGIYNAGFLYADESNNIVHLLFFPDALKKETSDYMIPYLWHIDENKSSGAKDTELLLNMNKLVDRMFLIIRNNQDPWGRKIEYPEYLLDMPWGPFPSSIKESMKVLNSPYRKELFLRNRYGIHYCPIGEVTFFCYAWRLLLRRIEANCKNIDFQSTDGLSSDENKLWIKDCWSKKDLSNTFEQKIYLDIIKSPHEWNFDTFPTSTSLHPWLNDWVRLLLINPLPNGKFYRGSCFGPLLKYISAFPSRYLKNSNQDFSTLIDECKNLKTEFVLKDIMKIDGALQIVVDNLINDIRENNSSENDIIILRRISRFPIIAYFYWNALERIPKTHLVTPTWSSFSTPLKILRRMFESDTNIDIQNPSPPFGALELSKSEEVCPLIGSAVVGISPLQGLDWTLINDDYLAEPTKLEEQQEAGDWRIKHICELINLIAQPQIDSSYYGMIRRRDFEKIATERLLRSYGHDAQRIPEVIIRMIRKNEKIISAKGEITSINGPLQFFAETLSNRFRAFSSFTDLANVDDKKKEDYLRNQEINRKSSLPLSVLWKQEMISVIIRFILSYDELSNSHDPYLRNPQKSDEIYLKLLSILNNRQKNESDLTETIEKAIDVIKELNFVIQLEHYDVGIPYSMPSGYLGPPISSLSVTLSFIMNEVITNFFKHGIDRNKAKDNSIQCIIVPHIDKSTDKLHISFRFNPCDKIDKPPDISPCIGLTSLKLFAEKIGASWENLISIKIRGVDNSEDLPWFRIENGWQIWDIKNISGFISNK